jgi:hypothetical protein
MTMATTPPYSPEQLRQAWQAKRKPSWPATFEEALADPLCELVIRLAARCLALRSAKRPAPSPTTSPRPAHAVPVPTHQPMLDHKRRAAGERDDD